MHLKSPLHLHSKQMMRSNYKYRKLLEMYAYVCKINVDWSTINIAHVWQFRIIVFNNVKNFYNSWEKSSCHKVRPFFLDYSENGCSRCSFWKTGSKLSRPKASYLWKMPFSFLQKGQLQPTLFASLCLEILSYKFRPLMAIIRLL